jgi:NAD+ synthase
MSLVPRLPAHAEAAIHQFLRAQVKEAGCTGVVVGLSGGVDSALAARLAKDALGAEKVLGLLLPDEPYPASLLEETKSYASSLGITTRVLPIAGVEEAVHRWTPQLTDRLSLGNAKARIRMIALYGVARETNRLVMGTGNKSEILLGYFTKYGDGGVDVAPLGDLYKSQVYELARHLGVPSAILDRAPTAGLYEGQTDEAELGLPYRDLDAVLHGIEELHSIEEIRAQTGLSDEVVRGVEARVSANRHKRRPPPIPKLSLRTVGLDWRD